RAIVVSVGPAGGVGAEAPLPIAVPELDVGGPVARGYPPDGGAVVGAAARVRDRVGLLRVDSAPAVLEIVHTPAAHVVVLDLAEIHPHVGVLMTEEGREAQVFLAEDGAPVLVISARPLGPG